MKKIKWGILGPGRIAHKFATDLMLSEHGMLYAVASRDFTKAESFAAQYQATKICKSYESLAKDPDVDVVYIATPHTFHFEHTMLCLKNGKSVLCEKPMGMTPLEVQALIAEAQKRKLFLMEGLWTRFIPATEKVLSLLNSNVIGTVSNLKADFGFQAVFNKKHRLFDKSLGGGSLLDIGIYPLYISLLLLGVPVKIGANARMTDTGVDATCEMVLCYNDSVNAQLKSTIENDTPTQAVITGEKGTITIHKPFHHSQKITVQTNGYNQVYELPYECFGYLFEIEEVNSCLAALQTESTKLPLQTSFELHRIIDRVLKKIQLEY